MGDYEFHMNLLSSLVLEQGKTITYRYVAQNFGVSSNYAKQMLFHFYEKNGNKIHPIYCITGISKDNQLVITITNQETLYDIERSLKQISSKHIYSVSSLAISDSAQLWLANKEISDTSDWRVYHASSSIKTENVEMAPKLAKTLSSSSSLMMNQSSSKLSAQSSSSTYSKLSSDVLPMKKEDTQIVLIQEDDPPSHTNHLDKKSVSAGPSTSSKQPVATTPKKGSIMSMFANAKSKSDAASIAASSPVAISPSTTNNTIKNDKTPPKMDSTSMDVTKESATKLQSSPGEKSSSSSMMEIDGDHSADGRKKKGKNVSPKNAAAVKATQAKIKESPFQKYFEKKEPTSTATVSNTTTSNDTINVTSAESNHHTATDEDKDSMMDVDVKIEAIQDNNSQEDSSSSKKVKLEDHEDDIEDEESKEENSTEERKIKKPANDLEDELIAELEDSGEERKGKKLGRLRKGETHDYEGNGNEDDEMDLDGEGQSSKKKTKAKKSSKKKAKTEKAEGEEAEEGGDGEKKKKRKKRQSGEEEESAEGDGEEHTSGENKKRKRKGKDIDVEKPITEQRRRFDAYFSVHASTVNQPSSSDSTHVNMDIGSSSPTTSLTIPPSTSGTVSTTNALHPNTTSNASSYIDVPRMRSKRIVTTETFVNHKGFTVTKEVEKTIEEAIPEDEREAMRQEIISKNKEKEALEKSKAEAALKRQQVAAKSTTAAAPKSLLDWARKAPAASTTPAGDTNSVSK